MKDGDDLQVLVFERPRIVVACNGPANGAFALIGSLGSVITWGDSNCGGDSSEVKDALASGALQV